MKKRTVVSAVLLVLFIFGSAITGSTQRAPITGDWRIEFTPRDPDQVQLTMTRGRQHNWGNGIKISEVQGLSRDYATAAANVTLRIVRDAGTFELTGSFRDGQGSGRFALTPDESFFSALAARGYTNLNEDQVFSAAISGMKISSIDELKGAGYDHPTFDNLIEATLFKITAASIADLRDAGFDHLPFNKLVEASIFKVDSNFVREVQGMGFSNLQFQKLIELRVHKITPEYLNEIRQLGFSDLPLDKVVELKIFKVTPEFVNEIRAAGFASVTPQELVNLRIFKVDGDYARRARSQDPNITVEKMVEQRIFEKRPGQ